MQACSDEGPSAHAQYQFMTNTTADTRKCESNGAEFRADHCGTAAQVQQPPTTGRPHSTKPSCHGLNFWMWHTVMGTQGIWPVQSFLCCMQHRKGGNGSSQVCNSCCTTVHLALSDWLFNLYCFQSRRNTRQLRFQNSAPTSCPGGSVVVLDPGARHARSTQCV